MELNPVPVLMSMVIFSNVGGAATPVGDPPNVIIATHPAVLHEVGTLDHLFAIVTTSKRRPLLCEKCYGTWGQTLFFYWQYRTNERILGRGV